MEKESRPQPAGSTIASRVRLVHLLYATALIYSAHVTFGVSGILLAVVLSACWARVYWSEPRTRGLAGALLILLLVGTLYALLAPAFSAAQGAATRSKCSNNLKQISIALHNYHDAYKAFPPAYIADENGRPLHSWRVLILPFLEHQPLYDAYRFDEPWDGPNNRELLSKISSFYSCPGHNHLNEESQFHTNYVVVVGENTVWPGEAATTFNRIIDGTSNTLLVCEVGDRQVPWMQPTDIGYGDAIALLTTHDPDPQLGHILRSFFYEWSSGRNVALADGSVHFLVHGIKDDEARRLLTLNDGEPLDFDALDRVGMETRRLRIDNGIRLGVFVLLALWPLPWVWINPHGSRAARLLSSPGNSP